MTWVKNQNVSIIENKVISMQNNSTPGVYIKYNVDKNSKYNISIKIKEKKLHGLIKLWITDVKKKPIYYKTIIDHIQYQLNANVDIINIGILFSGCKKYDYFVLDKFDVDKFDIDKISYDLQYYQMLPNGLRWMQDFVMSKIKDDIYLLFGYSDGIMGKYQKLMKKYPQCQRGFVNSIYRYNIVKEKWSILKKNPLPLRQGTGSINIEDKTYIFGGYNYTITSLQSVLEHYRNKINLPDKRECITYDDAYIFDGSNFTKLPNLPHPMSNIGITYNENDRSIYLVGGSIYDKGHWQIYNGIGVGYMIYKINIDNPTKYNYVSSLPGTARMNHICHIYKNNLYIYGGIIVGNNIGPKKPMYNTVIDNWKYDISTKTWTQLNNSKYQVANMSSVMVDQYIVMFGGAVFGSIVSNYKLSSVNKSTVSKLDLTSMLSVYGTHMGVSLSSSILIYDTENDIVIKPNIKLPYYVNIPKLCFDIHDVYIYGGESNHFIYRNEQYFRHPNIFIKFNITDLLKN